MLTSRVLFCPVFYDLFLTYPAQELRFEAVNFTLTAKTNRPG